MKKLLTGVICSLFLFLGACDDKEEAVTYTNSISNDLSGCASAGCHEAGSPVGSLANYDDVKIFVSFGRILGAVKHEDGFSPMPKGGDKWSDEKIERLEDWINAGLPE